MSNIWMLLQNLQQLLSEMQISAGELESNGWEDLFWAATVLEVPRTEEAGSELSILEGRLGERLGDGRFSGPGQTIEPEDRLAPFFFKPMFNILEDVVPCSLQTPLSVRTEMPGVRSRM